MDLGHGWNFVELTDFVVVDVCECVCAVAVGIGGAFCTPHIT